MRKTRKRGWRRRSRAKYETGKRLETEKDWSRRRLARDWRGERRMMRVEERGRWWDVRRKVGERTR